MMSKKHRQIKQISCTKSIIGPVQRCVKPGQVAHCGRLCLYLHFLVCVNWLDKGLAPVGLSEGIPADQKNHAQPLTACLAWAWAGIPKESLQYQHVSTWKGTPAGGCTWSCALLLDLLNHHWAWNDPYTCMDTEWRTVIWWNGLTTHNWCRETFQAYLHRSW